MTYTLCRTRAAAWALILALLLVVGCKKERAPKPSTLQPSAVAPASETAPASPTGAASIGDPPLKKQNPSFLWTIPGKKNSYLFGTIHVPDKKLATLAPEVRRALMSSDVVFTEIPMDAGTQLRLAPKLMLPKGKTLQKVLPADLYARLDKAFQAKGVPLAPLNSLKIWAIAVHVVMLDRIHLLAFQKPLDAMVYEQAEAAGKEVGGLETAEEQLQLFDSLDQAEQVHMLGQTLDQIDEYEKKGKSVVSELLGAYLSGEEKKVQEILTESFDPKDPVDKKLMERVFTNRNASMSERIQKKLQASPERSFFFAVGVGHAPGDDGIVARLKKGGFKVSRGAPKP